jgi:hypothetical protein
VDRLVTIAQRATVPESVISPESLKPPTAAQYYFFLENAGELRIIILSRKKGYNTRHTQPHKTQQLHSRLKKRKSGDQKN